ncbi:UDP-N-acetylglucosamine transferase subunit ALG14 homolog [Astyanax mexicanus]|uniref:UDP-N-acetylglucosamine transferase subunit ALG14 n=1 Tax=Astyanax mexicanus TaxID=7994 RepID=A0A3B1JYN9_ASTMX|nr:UDP-N-acetylglucosamine transferase subunit ALG14 homolog [Astyanax mexicanus]
MWFSVMCGVFCGVLLVFIILVIRLYAVLRGARDCRPGVKGSVCVLVVAGSGGHTTEIIRLMGSLSQAYSPRHYVIADTDKMSEDKIRTFEASKVEGDSLGQFTIHWIPRSREVRQSWSSSVLSTLNALLYSIPLVFRLKPDVVLCNGPGTCIPLCVAGLLLGILGLKRVLLVYVESICRVESLSLSGKILYHLSDYFFVQWQPLQTKYPKSIYMGRIV